MFVPFFAMALQPAFGDGSNEAAPCGQIKMFCICMLLSHMLAQYCCSTLGAVRDAVLCTSRVQVFVVRRSVLGLEF